MISVPLAAASRYIFLIHYCHYCIPYLPFWRNFPVMFFDQGRDAAGLVRFEAFKSGVEIVAGKTSCPALPTLLLVLDSYPHLRHHE